jgi:hypothetical protein
MAYSAHKTEHRGLKKGCGAYWGSKAEAKKESNRRRQEQARRIVKQETAMWMSP